MKKSSALIIAATTVLIAVVWFLWPRRETEVGAAVPSQPGQSASSTPTASPAAARASAPAAAPLEISHIADQLNSPATDIRADLRILTDVLANFRSNFPHDGNPVGNNAEITATLTGQNKLRYAVIPPKHPAINRVGELCDRWGTPLFFHAESATKMGIRSAGPDKKMWTDDDIATGP